MIYLIVPSKLYLRINITVLGDHLKQSTGLKAKAFSMVDPIFLTAPIKLSKSTLGVLFNVRKKEER